MESTLTLLMKSAVYAFISTTNKAQWVKLQSIIRLSKIITLNWGPELDCQLYYLRDQAYCYKLANLRPEKPHSPLSLIYPSIKTTHKHSPFYNHHQGGSCKGGTYHHLIRTYLLSPLRLHSLCSSHTKAKLYPGPQSGTTVSSVLGI